MVLFLLAIDSLRSWRQYGESSAPLERLGFHCEGRRGLRDLVLRVLVPIAAIEVVELKRLALGANKAECSILDIPSH